MKIATWVFRIAGAIGLLQIVPLYFYEAQLAVDMPPALNHPEYYYGMLGVTMAWQIAFLFISTDVLRYRPLMPVAMLADGPRPLQPSAVSTFGSGRFFEPSIAASRLSALVSPHLSSVSNWSRVSE